MCCRYLLLQEHARAVLNALGVGLGGPLSASRYNVAPGTLIPVIRNAPKTQRHESAALHWGLVPAWAHDATAAPVNARAETLADRSTFREAFRARRCLVLASGFYEWAKQGRVRSPWLFRLRDERPFCLAGLWETWRAPDGSTLESCAVITTAPNALMRPIHHRMPAILADSTAWARWLDPHVTEPSALAPLLQTFSANAMTALAVSSRVSNVRHDDPACLAPAGPETAATDSQLGFAL